ncbi:MULTISPECIES: epimerase [unclassified Serratia (in: enterobacteria)]|uniref:epimerase n=1 Tax=unclassified Serratia (in: enterobacteria) TaxID=2647522 RepID=UPI000469B369|nr:MULTISPECIES: epimerase [unclassified Serratia (in: enterobacteria)]
MPHLHPSLASANPLKLGETLAILASQPISTLHLDIEDTSFISNITFGMKTVNAIAQASSVPLSFHLMLANPFPWLQWIAPLRPAWVFLHAEALANPAEGLAAIRQTGAQAGLAFNPATPLAPYKYLKDRLEGVLIMTSEPDGAGQDFIPTMRDKIAEAATFFPHTEIWADGGIDISVAPQLVHAGARHLVLGRAVFGSSNIPQALRQFQE